MATTSIIVEMLIIGFFACIWIFLLIIQFVGVEVNCLIKELSNLSSWSTAILFSSTAIIYQLGWMVNWISVIVFSFFSATKISNPIFAKENLDYLSARTIVNQFGSSELHRELNIDRSVIRLSRAGVINFLLIAIGIFLLFSLVLSVVFLLSSILCGWQWYHRYKRYHEKILAAYKIISAIK